MARSTYPIPTRDTTEYRANDGQWYDSERKVRQVNARLSVLEICQEQGWQGVVTAEDVAEFIVNSMSALAPLQDDLDG